MMRKNSLLILGSVAVSVLQVGFLGWIISSRAAVLRDGREILLKVAPVDPRDLLRGDYVSLRYDIDAIHYALIDNAPKTDFTTEAGPIFVRLMPGGDGFWHPVVASLDAPSTSNAASGAVTIRGEIHSGRSFGPGYTIDVDYGINRYYLPEGGGQAIESNMRERVFGVKLAVAADGTAQIKALMDGDTLLYEEPLY